MSLQIIAPTTSSITASFTLTAKEEELPANLLASGTMSGLENIAISVVATYGTYSYTIPIVIGGTAQQLSANNSVTTIIGPGNYQVVKSSTVNAVGLFLATNKRP
jgi:hypothetical protein